MFDYQTFYKKMYFFKAKYLDFFHRIRYISNRNKIKLGGSVMHIIDKEICIGCGACEGVCPVSAISAN